MKTLTKEKIWLSSPHMGGKEEVYVQEAFESNWIAPLGPNLVGFERDIEAFVGHGVHASGLSSGTAALHLALDEGSGRRAPDEEHRKEHRGTAEQAWEMHGTSPPVQIREIGADPFGSLYPSLRKRISSWLTLCGPFSPESANSSKHRVLCYDGPWLGGEA